MPHNTTTHPLQHVHYRRATLDDIPSLLEIETLSFPTDRLSRRQIRYHIQNPKSFFLVAQAGEKSDTPGQVIGCGLVFLSHHRPARIYSLAARPQYRGTGLGRVLMETMLRFLQDQSILRVRLEVRAQHKRLIAFYESFGFTQQHALPHYYEDGADGIKMERVVTPPSNSTCLKNQHDG